MSEPPIEIRDEREPQPRSRSDRLVYVMPEQELGVGADDEIDLREIWKLLWRKRLLIVGVTLLVSAGATAYALLATEWYRAEVVLVPVQEDSGPSLGGQLGGLAALAGVGTIRSGAVEAVAVLESRDFARAFIDDEKLIAVLFSERWDSDLGKWRESDPTEWPDTRDAVEYFGETVLHVSKDIETSLVTLAIEWKDAEVAAAWANSLARRLNAIMRDRALRDAERNVEYLRSELGRAPVVALQQSIGRLLEAEMQKLMLARGNEEFAFRVIDTAEAPKRHARPKRTLIVVLGAMAGGVMAVFGVLIAHALRDQRTESSGQIRN